MVRLDSKVIRRTSELFLKHFKLTTCSSFLTSVREAACHLTKKINWFSDGLVNAKIVTPEEVSQSAVLKNEAVVSTNCLIAFHLNSTSDLSLASEIFQLRKTGMYPAHGDLVSQFALECNVNVDDSNGSAFKSLSSSIVGRYDSENPSIISKVLPWTKAASHRRLHQKMAALFERRDSDDFVLALMLFFDLCTPLGVNIPWVKHSIDGKVIVFSYIIGCHIYSINIFFRMCVCVCVKLIFPLKNNLIITIESNMGKGNC